MANGDNQPVTPDSGSVATDATAPAPSNIGDTTPDAGAAPSPAPAAAYAPSPSSIGDTTPDAGAGPSPASAAAPPPEKHMFQKIYDGVLTALGGAKTVTFSMPDPKTGQIVKHEDPATPGQQWKRIIAGALSGLAASGGAGTGPGAKMRGLALGVQGGFQAADRQQAQQDKQKQELGEDYDRQQRIAQEQARTAMLNQGLLQARFTLGRDEELAQDADRTAEQQLVAAAKAGGDDARDLGVHPHVMSLVELAKENPQLHIDQTNGQLISAAHVNDEGKRDGIHMVYVTPNWKAQTAPPGSKALKIVPGKDGLPTLDSEEATPGTKNGELHDSNMKVQTDFANMQLKIREQENKDKEEARKSLSAPLEEEKTKSEIAANYARATKDKGDTAQQQAQKEADRETLAQAMFDGDIAPKDLKRAAAKTGVDPNSVLTRAVEIGKEKGQPFSEPQLTAESKFYEDKKTQAVLNGIDRLVGTPNSTGQIDNVISLAKQAGLHDFAPLNTGELFVRRWGGDDAAKDFQTGLDTIRREIATLVGNPALGSSDSDMKLKAANELFGSNPTLSDLKSTGDVLKQSLISQRNAMAKNNRYIRRAYETTAPQLPPEALDKVTKANGQPVVFGNGQVWQMQNGQPTRVK